MIDRTKLLEAAFDSLTAGLTPIDSSNEMLDPVVVERSQHWIKQTD